LGIAGSDTRSDKLLRERGALGTTLATRLSCNRKSIGINLGTLYCNEKLADGLKRPAPLDRHVNRAEIL